MKIYDYIVDGFMQLFNQLPEVKFQTKGYPKTVQVDPLLAHIFDGMTQTQGGGVITRTYRIIHRAYFRWSEWEVAEMDMGNLADTMAHLIATNPQLLEVISESNVNIPNCAGGSVLPDIAVRTGFADFSSSGLIRYRVMDMSSTTVVKLKRS